MLVLTLHASSYDWKFVATDGTVVDSGITPCHGGQSATPQAARDTAQAQGPLPREPQLVFGADPRRTSLKAATRRGLPVSIHCSRACDVAVGVWLQRRGRLRRIATFYESESEIPKPDSRIVLPLGSGQLSSARPAALLLRFAAVDAAGHRRVLTRTVTLK